MYVGGIIFAGIAVLCVVAGFTVLRGRGDFEPLDEEEEAAEAAEDDLP